MLENKEIVSLFKNIQQGVKKHGVKQLNEALNSFLSQKSDKNDSIEYVISIVCKEYSIPLSMIKLKNQRGTVHDAKETAYCLLHLNLGLNVRYIAEKIFNTWPTSVSKGIKRYKESNVNLKADKEFVEKYKNLEEKLLIYIQKQY